MLNRHFIPQFFFFYFFLQLLIVCKCYATVRLKCILSVYLIEPNFTMPIEVHLTSHNSFVIKCDNLTGSNVWNVWNGEKGIFTASVKRKSNKVASQNNSKCWFLFSDLNYLTTYDIEVFKSNLISFSICHSFIPNSHMCNIAICRLSMIAIFSFVLHRTQFFISGYSQK